MIINNLPKDPGLAGWNEILPARQPSKSLEKNITCDWLVIGAGFAGLAAARRLRQLHPTDTIAVLEARNLAEGPIGRNSGFMIDIPHNLTSRDYASARAKDLQHIAMNRRAIEFAFDAVEEFEMSHEALSQCGKVNSAATAKGHAHNLEFAGHLKSLNEPFELLDAKQLKEISGTTYYRSGLFTPGTAILQPALFARGMADGLARNNIQIYENSPVIELSRKTGNWQAKTPSGSVSTPKVILAVNGHVQSFGYFQSRLMHVFLYASMTRILNPSEVAKLGGAPQWNFTPSDPMGTTVRRISGTSGDRIIVRNRFTYNPSRHVNDSAINDVAGTHDAVFAARFPMLKNVSMQYRWGGLLCLSANSVPAFGELEEGLFSACCQNGLGAAKGTLSGILAAEQASNIGSELLDQTLALDAPRLLPPAPLSKLGATALMRWRELRCGREF